MFAAKRGPSDIIFMKGQGSRKDSKDVWSNASTSTAADDDSDRSSDAWVQQDRFMQVMPPPGLQSYTTPVEANRPSDFAMAWNAAANVGGWKREEPELRSKQQQKRTTKKREQTQKKTVAPKVTAAPKEGRDSPPICAAEQLFDIPLPKWCAAEKLTGPVARTTASPHSTPTMSPAIIKGSVVESTQEALDADCAFAFASGHVEQPQTSCAEQLELPVPGFCKKPLKVFLPQDSYTTSKPSLNKSIPCKKRVPDWGF
jgi:hypothetical protein